MPVTERYRGTHNLMTPHGTADYPGLLVVAFPKWPEAVIVPADGQTVIAQGGESAYAFELADGSRADGFRLRPGDRATRISSADGGLAEWSVERAG